MQLIRRSILLVTLIAPPAQADLIYELCVTEEGEARAAYCQCNEDYLKEHFTDEEYALFVEVTEVMANGGGNLEAQMVVSGYDWDILRWEDFREEAAETMDAAEEACK